MAGDRQYRQSRMERLAAETRLYARALTSLSDVDFETELATWQETATEIAPWLATLNARELAVLALTGDRPLVEAMVQARPDG